MMMTPNRTWPTQKLACPAEQHDATIRFSTPIGTICWNLANQRSLGLLIFEELSRTYEHGPVQIHAGDVVLDLGAHIGTFTRYALHRGASRVIAFEPEPSHIGFLKQTFADEIARGAVSIIEAAAWKEAGSARFESAGVGSRICDSGPYEVRLTTVDSEVSALGLDRVDFIKADIEGAERHALRGAAGTIKQFGPRMAICTYHLPDDPEVIADTVTSMRPYKVIMNASSEQAFFHVPSTSAVGDVH